MFLHVITSRVCAIFSLLLVLPGTTTAAADQGELETSRLCASATSLWAVIEKGYKYAHLAVSRLQPLAGA